MPLRSSLTSPSLWRRLSISAENRFTLLACRQGRIAAFSNTSRENVNDDVPLRVSQKDGVLTMTLNRPKQRNALNRSLLKDLEKELERARIAVSAQEDPSMMIRSIVLQSSSSVFSSGHDLRELQAMKNDPSQQLDLMKLCSRVMQLLSQDVPQPTVAVVQGVATAAGCQLAAACDLVVACREKAQFSTPGANTIGLFCHTPGVPLVRSVGLKRAKTLLYTGQVLSAQEAYEYGLVSHLVESSEDAKEYGAQLAQQIATNGSFPALALGKQVLHQQMQAPTLKEAYDIANDAMVENLQTQDAQSGISNFLNKQTHSLWKHR